jgi:hypothetical protein
MHNTPARGAARPVATATALTTTFALLAACGGGQSDRLGPPQPVKASVTACTVAAMQDAVAALGGELRTTITSASPAPAGSTATGGAVSTSNPALPEHCVVTGTIDEHRGDPADTLYGNKFRLRMPTDWNGRLYFMGGGGNNGSVADAVGTFRNQPGQTALTRGYAVIAQDSGHIGSSPTFALDAKAYTQFAHQSVHDATTVGKTVLARYFGQGPQRSYFVGCSNGGREAMVTAQRYDDFDGVVAGAPALNMFDQWIGDAWNLRAVAELAGTPAGQAPTSTSGAYSDDQLAYIARYFTGQCDAQDGVADGLVQNFKRCTATAADLRQLQCVAQGGASTDAQCLSAAQAATLGRIYRGPVTSTGAPLFPGANPGGIELNLRAGLLGSGPTGLGSLYQTVIPNLPYMGYGHLGYPGAAADPRSPASYPSGPAYVARFDFDADPVRLAPGRLLFHGDRIDTSGTGPNFDRFVRRGGKMIIYSGTADPSVKAPGIAEFVDKLRAHYSPNGAETFARAFFVPGMGHCSGGSTTTDSFDMLTPLVDWVENGVAPERITARATPGNALDPNRTGVARPLCVYPRYARYAGTGDRASAANYTCVAD